VCGNESLRDGRGLAPIEILGNGRQRPLVRDDELGVPAAADDAEDSLANLPERGSRSARRDLAGDLHARNVRWPPRWRGISTFALKQVGAIERARANAHEHLACSRLWSRDVAHLQHLGATGAS